MRAMLDSGAARVATLEREGDVVPVSLYEVLAFGYNGMARYDRAITLDSLALQRRIGAGDPDTWLSSTRWQLAEDRAWPVISAMPSSSTTACCR